MADTTQEMLLETFREASSGLSEDVASLTSAYGSEAQADTAPRGSPSGQVTEAGESPDSSTASAAGSSGSSSGLGVSNGSGSSSTASSGSGTSEALSIATTVLESGLGVVPLIAGLVGLFTGGNSSSPSPLVKYAMPDSMQFEGVDTGTGSSDADFDQMGMPRDYSGTPAGSPSTGAGSGTASTGGSGGSTASSPQIQVNVQAMDAQSFMDHSSDIAQAVRSAMLNLSSLNDVVSDL